MPLYAYTGYLTDLGGAPFPDAVPRLWVEADRDTMGPDGPLPARKRVPVSIGAGGSFSILLTASQDTNPPIQYALRCEWLDGDTVLGFAEWQFTAYPGGGPISSGFNAPVAATWWVGPPWPPLGTRGMYYDKTTDDVGQVV